MPASPALLVPSVCRAHSVPLDFFFLKKKIVLLSNLQPAVPRKLEKNVCLIDPYLINSAINAFETAVQCVTRGHQDTCWLALIGMATLLFGLACQIEN